MEPKTRLPTAVLKRVLSPRQAVWFFPLLLMAIYAANCILRFAASPPPLPSYSFQSVVLHAHNSTVVVQEKTEDVRSFENHISSAKDISLPVRQEGTPASVSCSALINGEVAATAATRGFGAMDGAVLCCDRSNFRSDVCYMRGDVVADPRTSSIFVSGTRGQGGDHLPQLPETIRPYTRKWEAGIMSTINELKLIPVPSDAGANGTVPRCDVRHGVPAVVFSAGGYTGNVYHAFNDGLLPLYLTAERFHGEVVLVVLEYHSWWFAKYGSLLRCISNHTLVDFGGDRRVHCFPEMIVGLRIHGELTIDPRLTPSGKDMRDFQELLGQSFGRSTGKEQHPSTQLLSATTTSSSSRRKPKLVILVRTNSRVLLNLRQVVKASQRVGFDVHLLNPKMSTPMTDLYQVLHAADAVVAVLGAAITHLLFMRPKSVLIQIVPLGLDMPGEVSYGQPARSVGLDYMEYKVLPQESSLWGQYDRRDPVIANPQAITSKGWPELKKVYLDHQNVRVNVRRFRKVLARAYSHVTKSQPRF